MIIGAIVLAILGVLAIFATMHSSRISRDEERWYG